MSMPTPPSQLPASQQFHPASVATMGSPRATGLFVPSLRDVGIAALLGLGLPVLAVAAFLVLVKVSGLPGSVVPWVFPVATLPGAVGLGWWAIRRRGWGWSELGFTRPTRSLWHLLWEGPLAIAASAIIAASVGPLLGIAPSTTSSASVTAATGPLMAISLLLASVVLFPAVEEVLFRRFLFGWFTARMPIWAAVLLTGALFGLMHISPAIISYILPLGIALTALRAWHGSVWASLLVHMANNALVALLVLGAS